MPPGYLIDARWLDSQEIDRRLAHKYVRSGWLEPVVRGVYRRPPTSPSPGFDDWRLVVRSIQFMNYEVHVGGRTALALKGYSHYLGLDGYRETVYLHGQPPAWLKRLPAGNRFVIRSRRLFGKADLGLTTDSSGPDDQVFVAPLTVSSPERAILEMLNELPKHEQFEHVGAVFEGLASLRPGLLTELLGECRSIKVKRLFLTLCDRDRHAWRKHLAVEDFDLGIGPRSIMTGGKVHARYHITVPSDWISSADPSADGP